MEWLGLLLMGSGMFIVPRAFLNLLSVQVLLFIIIKFETSVNIPTGASVVSAVFHRTEDNQQQTRK